MDVRRITFKNFMPYHNETLDIMDLNGVLLILGMTNGDPALSNGSGKSAMVEGLIWGAWGESRMKSDDDLITTGEEEMSVQVEFKLNNMDYIIFRKRVRGKKSELLFSENNRSITENSIKATQAVINSKLLSYELYLNTGYFKQQEFDVLARQTPANRKAILMELLPLQVYSGALEIAKDHISSLEKDIYAKESMLAENQLVDFKANKEEALKFMAEAESQIKLGAKEMDTLTAELQSRQQEYGQFQGKLQLLENLTDEFKKSLREVEIIEQQCANNARVKENEVSEVKAEIVRCQDQVNSKDKTDGILKEIDAEIKRIAEVKLEVGKLIEERHGLTEQGIIMQRNLPTLKAEVEKLRKKYQSLAEVSTPDCPLCGSELDEGKVNKVLAEIEAEGKVKKAQMEEIDAGLKAIGEQVRAVDERAKKQEATIQKERELERDKKKYEALVIDIQIAQNRIAYMHEKQEQILIKFASDDKMISSMREEKIKRNAELDEKIKKIDIDKTAVIAISFSIESKQQEIKRKQAELDEYSKKIGTYQQSLQHAEELEKRDQYNRQKLAELKEEMFVYAQLSKAFGKDGIPALVLENVIPEIEAEANAILGRLSSGSMRINLLTQREKKSGGLTETLDIIISNEKGSRPYESYSGGQKMRINMAIRLALSKILCQRSGTKIETVVIDEVDALDEAGVRGFVDVINDMHRMFKKIIIISHISELKEYFKKTITVNYTEQEGSKINI